MIDAGSEPVADSNTIKDYLKQRIESQFPNAKLAEQQSFDAKARLKQYEDNLKQQAELSPIASQHSIENSELAKEIQPTVKKYQEFKNKSQVFSDLMQCLGGGL